MRGFSTARSMSKTAASPRNPLADWCADLLLIDDASDADLDRSPRRKCAASCRPIAAWPSWGGRKPGCGADPARLEAWLKGLGCSRREDRRGRFRIMGRGHDAATGGRRRLDALCPRAGSEPVFERRRAQVALPDPMDGQALLRRQVRHRRCRRRPLVPCECDAGRGQ